MDPGTATIIASLGIGSAVLAAVRAIVERRKTSADVTKVLNNAAVELVEPLRKALAAERAEHEQSIEHERAAVGQVRRELGEVRTQLLEALADVQRARDEILKLRSDLAEARRETREAHDEIDRWREKVRLLEEDR